MQCTALKNTLPPRHFDNTERPGEGTFKRPDCCLHVIVYLAHQLIKALTCQAHLKELMIHQITLPHLMSRGEAVNRTDQFNQFKVYIMHMHIYISIYII